MANFSTVPPNPTNNLARGGENAGVNSRDSGGVGAIANQTVARVLVSQVTPTTITLSNPQNKQSIQVSAKTLSTSIGSVAFSQGQAFDLVKLGSQATNKPNAFVLLAANFGGSAGQGGAQPSGQATINAAIAGKLPSNLLTNSASVNDNQISNFLSKASAQGALALSGKTTGAITGSVFDIVKALNSSQVSITFQVPGSNQSTQQAQLSLTNAQAQLFSKGSNIQVNVDFTTQPPKLLSITNLATKDTVTFTSSQSQLNKGALPSALLNSALLASLSNSNASALESGSALGGKLILPLNQSLVAQLPSTLKTSFQALANKALTEASSQNASAKSSGQNLFLAFEAGKTKGAISISILGNLQPQRFEITAAQAQALLIKGSSQAGGATPTNNISNTQSPLNTTIGAISSSINTPIPSKADLIAKNAAFNKQVSGFGNQASASPTASNTGSDKLGATSTNASVQFESNKLLQNLVSSFINVQGKASDALSTDTPSNRRPNLEVSSTKLGPNLQQLIDIAKQNTSAGNPASKGLKNVNSESAKLVLEVIQQISKTSVQQAKSPLSNEATLLDIKALAQSLDITTLKAKVQELNKQGLVLSGSQSQSISNINNAITSALNNTAELEGLSPETQTLLKTIKEQLPKTDAASPTLDSRAIQTLLASPMNPAPISPITATAQGGFLSGLVTLLQVSLASKLQRQSNKQASKLQDQLPEVVKAVVSNITGAQSAKLMQDFRQFDAKHTLSGEVAKLLANHHHNKVTSAESSLQGQDQLYYTLPNFMNKEADDLELLIKRETQEKKKGDKEEGVSSWYLTMKLDVGDEGKVLAKTQLTDNEIKLQLYTSTESLKNKALNMLPFLQRRLNALGIEIVERSCTIGKVPKQLKPEHYHLFEAKV